MKIAYLHQYFKKPSENGGTRSYDLASSFIKDGHIIDMITTTSLKPLNKGDKWRIENVNGIKVHYLYLPYDNSFSFLKRGWIFFQFIFYSFYRLYKLKPDVVLATSTPLTIGIPALLKKIVHRTPYIFETRDIWPEAVAAIGAVNNKYILKILYKLEHIIYKHAKFIVPLSVDMKSSIVNRFPQFNFKIKYVIENIAEIERFSNRAPKKDDILNNSISSLNDTTILYAGTFGKVNNIQFVIDLANRLLNVDSSIKFLLLGAGSEKDDLIKYAKELKVHDKNVFFLPPVGKGSLPEIYERVTLGSSFVAPIKELWANSANKFFDTLAAGKPIIINHEGWQADKIREKKIGIVLNSKAEAVDLEEFIEFIRNKEVLKEAGERARKLAIEEYSLDVATKKYKHILDSINVNDNL